MNQSTHIDMSLSVAEQVGWKGDKKLLARNAAYPDQVRCIEVEGYGAHVVGRNLASLAHFCRPINGQKPITYQGYCWMRDRSTPHIELSKRKVISKPAEWGFPTDEMTQDCEPLFDLVRTLTGHGCLEADEFTYPTAAVMAGWCEKVMRILPPALYSGARRQEALDTLAGWALHFVQDCCVPHHVECLLLKGHSGFEGDCEERWREWRGGKEAVEILKAADVDAKAFNRQVRHICEANALASQCSPDKLGWYRWCWRRGWNRLVDASLTRAARSSVEALRWLQKIE